MSCGRGFRQDVPLDTSGREMEKGTPEGDEVARQGPLHVGTDVGERKASLRNPRYLRQSRLDAEVLRKTSHPGVPWQVLSLAYQGTPRVDGHGSAEVLVCDPWLACPQLYHGIPPCT